MKSNLSNYSGKILFAAGRQPLPKCPRLALLLAAALCAVPVASRGNALPVTWSGPIEVAQGESVRGPWRMNESVWRFVDDPTAAVTDQGHAGVAWVDHARQDILFQMYAPDGRPRLAEPVNVSRSPGIFSWLPRMIMTSGDPEQVYILWQEIIFSGGTHGGEIFFARSTDGGRSFNRPLNLSNTIAGAGKGRLTREIWFNGSLDLAASDGILYAAWTEYEGALRFSRSTDRGESFSEPVRIAGGQGESPARGPSLAVGPGGEVHLVWTVGEDPAADIHYTRSTDQGQSFGSPMVIVESDGYSDAPKIAVDGRGTLHLVYAESPDGPLQRYHIRHTRSEEGGGAFQEPKEISGAHSEAFESVGFPYLDLDGEGNLYVLWELFPEEGRFPQGLGLTFSGDGGATFASPAVVPGGFDPQLGFNGSQQGLFMKKLAVNQAGEMAIVNSTFKPQGSSRIWLIRGRAGAGR
ncbi:MAG: exo-alpha-sialidase [Candidatus Zixiibacteriota bacterium]|nr:MAG: exo-alpha-sialidase [candidate division Zixibacteria bacterium]